ncbi:MAG: hypothetical protein HS129_14750 [Leptospiraceae bacterium]|nr:hypothetical protein [Leptospiraceae bacterium]
MSRNETRLKKLEDIAKSECILIRYLDRIIEKEWNGLYLRLPASGAAIAIRSDLTLPHKVWILNGLPIRSLKELFNEYNQPRCIFVIA